MEREHGTISGRHCLVPVTIVLLAMLSVGCRPADPLVTVVTPPPQYSVIDLGDLNATDINDKGQVVGHIPPKNTRAGNRSAQQATPKSFSPHLWENGKLRPLQIPSGGRFYQYALNNQGQIACIKVPDKNSWMGGQAALWADTKVHELGTLPEGDGSEAYAVNDVGQVVGKADDHSRGSGNRAFLWKEGKGMQDLGTLGGVLAEAHDINNRGEVVGWSNVRQRSLVDLLKGTRSDSMHGFFWKEGTMHDVGPLPGDRGSRAHALNGSGLVVGISWRPVPMKTSVGTHQVPLHRGFLWNNGEVLRLSPLPEYKESYTHHINDRGQVVGNCRYYQQVQYGLPRATLWQDRQPHDLNDLIPADSGWTLHNASRINNRGQIIGWGMYRDKSSHFLLTPRQPSGVKEP